jgi:hypothetical protein
MMCLNRAIIADEKQLKQTIEQMERMCRALASLNTEVLPQSRQQFALMAEGPLEEIRRLEEEISQYVARSLENLPLPNTD